MSCRGCVDGGLVLVELFAGLLPLSLAAERLNLRIVAVYASEVCEGALLVAQHNWPEVIMLGRIEGVTRGVVAGIVTRHTGARIVVAAGVPCRMSPSSAQMRPEPLAHTSPCGTSSRGS